MLQTRGYKYELRVNNKEKTLLTQCAGTARFAWNWGLESECKKETGKERYTDAMKQHEVINRLKKSTCKWMYNYNKLQKNLDFKERLENPSTTQKQDRA